MPFWWNAYQIILPTKSLLYCVIWPFFENWFLKKSSLCGLETSLSIMCVANITLHSEAHLGAPLMLSFDKEKLLNLMWLILSIHYFMVCSFYVLSYIRNPQCHKSISRITFLKVYKFGFNIFTLCWWFFKIINNL